MNKQQHRLTPEQFKAILLGKGWTFKEVAAYWEITPVWLSNLSRNPERAVHYDDALMQLPVKSNFVRHMKRRMATAEAYVQYMSGKIRKTYANRYHGQIVVGTILSVLEDIGSMAEQTMRGCVFNIRLTSNSEEYGVIFENGKYDWFPCDYIDIHLVETGLSDDSLSGYKFIDDAQVMSDYKKRRFKFSFE